MSEIRKNCLYLPLLLLLSLGLSACSEDSLVSPRPRWSDLVLYPEKGAVLVDDFDLTIRSNAVVYMIVTVDGSRIGTVTEPPFSWTLSVSDYEAGEHRLGVTLYYLGGVQSQVSARVLICHGVGTSVGNFAPLFLLDDLDGITHSPVASSDTKAILLDFWATWCGPCLLALPETQRLFEEYGDQGLKVLTINWESRDTLEPFMLDNGYTFPVLLDTDAVVSKLYNVNVIPYYLIIDHRGIVRYVRLGTGGTPLEDTIKPLL